ncbi:MAG: hypothetical protein GY832_25925 [Chloroflexi bacterium]|nr:hypothetical protein [Chloroflexota bacterium]
MATEVQDQNASKDEPGRKSKRSRPVTVEIITRQGKSVLVAWMDGDQYKRAYVPASKLKGNDIDAAALEKCPAYGVDWAAKFAHLPGAEIIANELRRQNIWTGDDFRRGRATVNAIMMKFFINPLVDELVKEL